MEELNYTYPEIENEDIGFVLETIYKFYTSKKWPGYTYSQFINDVKENNLFKETIFSRIIRISDNKNVGIIGMQPYMGEVFLEYIIVFPEYRNTGVATDTINFIKSIFEYQITLQSGKNEIDFFKKLGFEIISEEENVNSQMTPMRWRNNEI